ncbi:MAG: penicillin-binding transpeptidase domain-containing protein [Propioniciclava sp.]|uniref:penicillin-binding transpeptidase domain-containing protein n=1 Tax=Propioniciclava sp. TaxID=2038686 RepID=UPI0039E2D56D
MRRPVLAGLIVAVVAGLIGGGAWWFVLRPAQLLNAMVDRVVAGLGTGELPDADLTVPAAEDLRRIYAGMGELRPAVTRVGELTPQQDGSMATELAWAWVIHQGKPAWEYTTTLTVVRDGGAWRAQVDPAVVAPGLAAGESLRATRLTPVRGSIRGHDGAALATNTPAWRLGIDKTLTDAATAADSAAKLAELCGIDVERFVARVAGAGPRAFVEARILRQHEAADADLVDQAQHWIGVRAVPTTFPLGRTSSFARPLLGVVGEATAEQVEKSGGTIRAGDLAGRGGLQEARNHVLAGTTGFVIAIVDAEGKNPREVFRVEKLDGSDVVTTLDVDVQIEAERLLAGVVPASALVALRPSDGAILAAASGPGSQGHSTATLGRFAPGSTFKAVTSLALLRSGLTADSPVNCTDGVTVDGYRFDNWQGYPASALGSVPLHTALAHSCNSAFINARDAVSQPALADAAGSLGLTATPNLVVGGFLGEVPATAGGATEHAASLIGQGKVVASPLGMATVMASIVAGHPVTPVLVDEGRATPAPVQELSGAQASALRDLLANVPVEGGYAAFRGEGGVLAKTGTATYADGRYHGWLIAARGDLAVAAFVEDASSGATDAAPLAAALLDFAS